MQFGGICAGFEAMARLPADSGDKEQVTAERVAAGRPLLLEIRAGDSLNSRALWQQLDPVAVGEMIGNETHVVPCSPLMTFTWSLTNSPGSSHINTHKLWRACGDNARAYGGSLFCSKDITRRGEQKRHLWHQKCVCTCVCVQKSKNPQHKESSVCCSSKLSITLDSQGPFRTAVKRSPTLPVVGLELQDAPTTELHPVSLDQPQKVTVAASQENPVCQSRLNHPMCERDGSWRATEVVQSPS